MGGRRSACAGGKFHPSRGSSQGQAGSGRRQRAGAGDGAQQPHLSDTGEDLSHAVVVSERQRRAPCARSHWERAARRLERESTLENELVEKFEWDSIGEAMSTAQLSWTSEVASFSLHSATEDRAWYAVQTRIRFEKKVL